MAIIKSCIHEPERITHIHATYGYQDTYVCYEKNGRRYNELGKAYVHHESKTIGYHNVHSYYPCVEFKLNLTKTRCGGKYLEPVHPNTWDGWDD